METKRSIVVARGWEEERERGSFFNGYRVSVLPGKKVLEMSCTIL